MVGIYNHVQLCYYVAWNTTGEKCSIVSQHVAYNVLACGLTGECIFRVSSKLIFTQKYDDDTH